MSEREREREREGDRADTKCLTRETERERAVFEYSCDTILVTIYQSRIRPVGGEPIKAGT